MLTRTSENAKRSPYVTYCTRTTPSDCVERARIRPLAKEGATAYRCRLHLTQTNIHDRLTVEKTLDYKKV